MIFEKNDRIIKNDFRFLDRFFVKEGFTASEQDTSIPIGDRVEALEEAVTDIASEVYKNG